MGQKGSKTHYKYGCKQCNSSGTRFKAMLRKLQNTYTVIRIQTHLLKLRPGGCKQQQQDGDEYVVSTFIWKFRYLGNTELWLSVSAKHRCYKHRDHLSLSRCGRCGLWWCQNAASLNPKHPLSSTYIHWYVYRNKQFLKITFAHVLWGGKCIFEHLFKSQGYAKSVFVTILNVNITSLKKKTTFQFEKQRWRKDNMSYNGQSNGK